MNILELQYKYIFYYLISILIWEVSVIRFTYLFPPNDEKQFRNEYNVFLVSMF